MLPRAVGFRKAREMSVTSAFVDAHEALRIGLVNHVVPHEQLEAFARGLAASVSLSSAVGDMLELYRRSEELSVAGALASEAAFSAGRRYDVAAFAAAGRSLAKRQSDGSGEVR